MPEQFTHEQKSVKQERIEICERATEFVKHLVGGGVQPLKMPAALDGRKFFLTSRTIRNPNVPEETIDAASFQRLGRWANGFTKAWIIDLFEEIPPNSGVMIPVGHRDVRLAKFEETGEIRASGNMALSRNFYSQQSTTKLPEGFVKATQTADKMWGMNGIDILPSLNELKEVTDLNHTAAGIADVDEYELKQLLLQHSIPSDQSWSGLGFGRLLMAIELELLRQEEATQLETPSVSRKLGGIINNLVAAHPEPRTREDRINLTHIPPFEYAKLVDPFIPRVVYSNRRMIPK